MHIAGIQDPSCSCNIKPAAPKGRPECERIQEDVTVFPVTGAFPCFRWVFFILPLPFHLLGLLLSVLLHPAVIISHNLKTSRWHFLNTNEWQETGQCGLSMHLAELQLLPISLLTAIGNRCHKHINTHYTAKSQADRILTVDYGQGDRPVFCPLRLVYISLD